MFKRITIFFMLQVLMTSSYAALNSSTTQGAADYDWQNCFNSKSKTCANDCQTSTDKDCPVKCNQLATDKCKTEGFTPPS